MGLTCRLHAGWLQTHDLAWPQSSLSLGVVIQSRRQNSAPNTLAASIELPTALSKPFHTAHIAARWCILLDRTPPTPGNSCQHDLE